MKKEYYIYGVEVTEGEFNKYMVLNGDGISCRTRPDIKNQISAKDIINEKNDQKRMMLIRLCGMDNIYKEMPTIIIEEMSGTAVYSKYPIGDYIQHGDRLFISLPVKEIKWEEMPPDMPERLEGIVYKFMEIEISKGRKVQYLLMTNASKKQELHLEGVRNCKGIFEAICQRNKEKFLPSAIS